MLGRVSQTALCGAQKVNSINPSPWMYYFWESLRSWSQMKPCLVLSAVFEISSWMYYFVLLVCVTVKLMQYFRWQTNIMRVSLFMITNETLFDPICSVRDLICQGQGISIKRQEIYECPITTIIISSWSFSIDNGAGVNVYIIDTGINPTHTDYGSRAYTDSTMDFLKLNNGVSSSCTSELWNV